MIVTIRLTPGWVARGLAAVENLAWPRLPRLRLAAVRNFAWPRLPRLPLAALEDFWPRLPRLTLAALGVMLCASATADLPAALVLKDSAQNASVARTQAVVVSIATRSRGYPGARGVALKPALNPASKPDARFARLEKFFRLYHCPQPRHTSEYLRAADENGLDYRLLPAISIRETLCGVAATENNHWGYHPGRQSFPSAQEGIDFVARVLAEGFYYKGKTLRDKLLTYNPRAAYPDEVQWIMRQIE